jgi:hypothetical protein
MLKKSFMQSCWQWLKTFPRRHWIISTLLLLYAIYSGFWWFVFTPIRNPWPQEAFTIRGRFPFDKGYELMFYQNVYGKADWHQRLCGGGILYLLGVQTSGATCSNAMRGVWTKPRQTDSQHYEVTLYRDAYFDGLQDWTPNTWHTQFKANAGVDYTKLLITDYGSPENSACDDSEEFLRKYKGELFCTKQFTHKDYKELVIHEGQPAGPNERIQNFWLESELDQMLPKRK